MRLCVSIFLLALTTRAATPALEHANELEHRGAFKQAASVLRSALDQAPTSPGPSAPSGPSTFNLQPSTPPSERATLHFEIDRLERIRKDFPHTEDTLFTELQKSVKDLTRAEFKTWIDEGRFDSREIDGERRFMVSSVSNLFFRYPELNPRRTPPKDNTGLSRRHLEIAREIRQAALASGKPYVLPKRFHAVMQVTLAADASPEDQPLPSLAPSHPSGPSTFNLQPSTPPLTPQPSTLNHTIRAWLPIPRRYPFQNEIEFLRSAPEPRQMSSDVSPIRSVFMEQPARKGEPTIFSVEYAYTAYGVRFEVEPEEVKPANAADPQLQPFLAEGPHIVFSPEMRELSGKLLAGEKNPYLQAKKFHDWIADNIKYSYAIEYSTIRNIGEYCRARGYGDCGQEALLFMTLCRLNGVPARWQSGWSTFPGAKSIHDWAEIYVAPHGWMPVDPYMGIFAIRYATGLSPDEKRELRDFYFGGLNQYRMIANSDHNQTLSPPKKSMRSDTVDFQRGELECGDRNIYFDQYTYSLDINEIPLKVEAQP